MNSFTRNSLRHLNSTGALVSQLNLHPSANSFVPEKMLLLLLLFFNVGTVQARCETANC